MTNNSPISAAQLKALKQSLYNVNICQQKIALAEQAGLDCTECAGELEFVRRAIEAIVSTYGTPPKPEQVAE